MRQAPEDLAAAAHQVPSDVVEPGARAGAQPSLCRSSEVLRQERRMHRDVIEQRRLSALQAAPVELRPGLSALRQAVASREQQKEGEQHRNIDRDRADRMPPQGVAPLARERGAAVVLRPAPLVAEAEAAIENVVGPRTLAVVY